MQCPRDQQPLEPVSGKDAILRCPACGGAFVEHRALALMNGRAANEFAERMRDPLTAHSPDVDCPADGLRMFRVRHQDCEIDVCARCNGVWLDPGEIERITTSASLARKAAIGTAAAAGLAAASLAGASAMAGTPEDEAARRSAESSGFSLGDATSGIGDIIGTAAEAVDVVGSVIGAIASIFDGL